MKEEEKLEVNDIVVDNVYNLRGRVIRKTKRSIFVKYKGMTAQYSKNWKEYFTKVENPLGKILP